MEREKERDSGERAGVVSDDMRAGGKQSEREAKTARDWKRKTDEVRSSAFSLRNLPSIKCSASKWGCGGLCCRKLHYLQPQLCQSGHTEGFKGLIQHFILSHQIIAALGKVLMVKIHPSYQYKSGDLNEEGGFRRQGLIDVGKFA